MKKMLLSLFLMIGICSFSTIKQRITEIKKDYAETNSYKNYRIEKEDIDLSEGGEIRRYYKNNVLRKVVTEFYTGYTKQYAEYYIKNGKTYFKYLLTTYFYEGNRKEEKRYYYDNHENLIRYIAPSGKITDNENGLEDYEGSEVWED